MFGKGKKNQPPVGVMAPVLEKKAMEAFEEGDMQNALELFAGLNDMQPTSDRLYHLGVIADICGNQELAIGALLQSVEMDECNAQARYSLGIIAVQAGMRAVAREQIEAAYALNSTDFRVVNLYAKLLLDDSDPEYHDSEKALRLAEEACRLTEGQDEVCQQTLEEARAAQGVRPPEPSAEPKEQTALVDLTSEIMHHFESRFGRSSNENALQYILQPSFPVAVQTIESQGTKSSCILYTTGLSHRRMSGGVDHAELVMILPAGSTAPAPTEPEIWPWQSMLILAVKPSIESTDYLRKPQLVTLKEDPVPLGTGTEFVAFLFLPNVKGYIDPLPTKAGRVVDFFLVMPVYLEEYQLGVPELLKKIQKHKLKPHYKPGRPNLGRV